MADCPLCLARMRILQLVVQVVGRKVLVLQLITWGKGPGGPYSSSNCSLPWYCCPSLLRLELWALTNQNKLRHLATNVGQYLYDLLVRISGQVWLDQFARRYMRQQRHVFVAGLRFG